MGYRNIDIPVSFGISSTNPELCEKTGCKLCEEKCKSADIQSIREIQELKESLPKDEKKEAFRKCLISNQYLMMQKMLNIDDLSKYTSLELNIISKMGAYEYSNPPIEQRVKESIMKEVFGEDFYNANIESLQKEIDALPEKEKQEKLESINIDLSFFVPPPNFSKTSPSSLNLQTASFGTFL